MIEVLEGEWLAGGVAGQTLAPDTDGVGPVPAVDEATQARVNALVASVMG